MPVTDEDTEWLIKLEDLFDAAKLALFELLKYGTTDGTHDIIPPDDDLRHFAQMSVQATMRLLDRSDPRKLPLDVTAKALPVDERFRRELVRQDEGGE